MSQNTGSQNTGSQNTGSQNTGSQNTGFAQKLARTAQDAAYVAVGLGVIGFQNAQVRRRELAKSLGVSRQGISTQVGDASTQLKGRVRDLDDLVESAIGHVEKRLEVIEDHLPDQARELVQQARAQARDARAQLRHFLNGTAA